MITLQDLTNFAILGFLFGIVIKAMIDKGSRMHKERLEKEMFKNDIETKMKLPLDDKVHKIVHDDNMSCNQRITQLKKMV